MKRNKKFGKISNKILNQALVRAVSRFKLEKVAAALVSFEKTRIETDKKEWKKENSMKGRKRRMVTKRERERERTTRKNKDKRQF